MRMLMFFLFSLPMCILAQSTEKSIFLKDSASLLMRLDSLEEQYVLKSQVSYEVGTSAFTNFYGFYGFNTYVAPKIIFKPNKKWVVDGGLLLGRTQMYDIPVTNLGGASQQIDQTILTMGAYMRGTYLVNDKLYMGGSGFVSYNNIESSMPYTNRNAYNNIAGETFVGYKFSDSFKVEAGFSIGRFTPQNSYNYFSY